MKKTTPINDIILETFRTLRQYPLMVITKDSSYSLLQNYIEGYIDGLSIFLNRNMRFEITQWYKNKVNKQTSYYWTSHIPFHFSEKSEEELKEILLNITEEYFRSNPIEGVQK